MRSRKAENRQSSAFRLLIKWEAILIKLGAILIHVDDFGSPVGVGRPERPSPGWGATVATRGGDRSRV